MSSWPSTARVFRQCAAQIRGVRSRPCVFTWRREGRGVQWGAVASATLNLFAARNAFKGVADTGECVWKDEWFLLLCQGQLAHWSERDCFAKQIYWAGSLHLDECPKGTWFWNVQHLGVLARFWRNFRCSAVPGGWIPAPDAAICCGGSFAACIRDQGEPGRIERGRAEVQWAENGSHSTSLQTACQVCFSSWHEKNLALAAAICIKGGCWWGSGETLNGFASRDFSSVFICAILRWQLPLLGGGHCVWIAGEHSAEYVFSSRGSKVKPFPCAGESHGAESPAGGCTVLLLHCTK